MTSGEPSLNITSDGTLLRFPATNPLGIAVSRDNGATWTRRVLPEGAATGVDDTYLDRASGRYFQAAALSGTILYSDDLGETWQQGAVEYAPTEPLAREGDWPKIFSGPPTTPRSQGFINNIYYCNWTVPLGINSPFRCYKSINGGENFSPVGPMFQDFYCSNSVSTFALVAGRGIVSPDSGAIYLPVKSCEGLNIYVSLDEGETWAVYPIPGSNSGDIITILPGIISSTGLSTQEKREEIIADPIAALNFFKLLGPETNSSLTTDALGMDSNGGLYAVWIGEGIIPKFAYSANGGQSWTEPVAILPPGVIKGALPSISVTPEGKVGISYYGTTGDGTWTGYLAISKNASTISAEFETAAVTPEGEPLMNRSCCFGNGLNEFTSARWAPDGSLWAAFNAYGDDDEYQGMLGRLVPAAK